MNRRNLVNMTLLASLLILPLLSSACGGGGSEGAPWPAGDSSYVFDRPDEEFELAKDLDEISGLTTLQDGTLAAIQDESGELFILDASSGQVVAKREFGKKGDYEAVELAGDVLFVLRSDGRLFELTNWGGEEIAGNESDLKTPKSCDAEGLAFDGRRLLVSCKERPGPKLGEVKAIYSVDLRDKKLSDRPAYTIDPSRLAMNDHPVNEAVRSVLSDRLDLSGFKPSGLAVHPITGDLFVLSSVRKAIVALDPGGTVTAVWALPDNLVQQPEALAFLPNGDLFVASEKGGGKSARLFRYNFRGKGAEDQP